MSAYTDKTKVQNYLKRDLSAKEDAVFDMLAEAATEYIDSEIETNYQDVTEAKARYYDGDGDCEIDIDPCKTVTSVQLLDIDGNVMQTLAEADYLLYPVNKDIKTSIRFRFRISPGMKSIKVTAKFTSYTDKVPSSISLAATMLVAEYMQGDDQRIKSEETEGWRVSYDSLPKYADMVQDLLAPYRRVLL
jgi:hypothetical protein